MGWRTTHHTEVRLVPLEEWESIEQAVAVLNHPRPFVCVTAKGEPSLLSMTKHELVSKWDIPYRDMGTLDPLVQTEPAAAAIFVRNDVMIVAVESIRGVIGRKSALFLTVPTDDDISVCQPARTDCRFIQRLCNTLKHSRLNSKKLMQCKSMKERRMYRHQMAHGGDGSDADLPFEFVVLECVLSTAIAGISADLLALESLTALSLDCLIKKVSHATLEGVGKAKREVTSLGSRCARLEEELDDIMHDDDEMADMYLSRRTGKHPLEMMGLEMAEEYEASKGGVKHQPHGMAKDLVSKSSVVQADNGCDDDNDGHGNGVHDDAADMSSEDESPDKPSGPAERLEVMRNWQWLVDQFRHVGYKVAGLRHAKDVVGGTTRGVSAIPPHKKLQYRITGVHPYFSLASGGDVNGQGGMTAIGTVEARTKSGSEAHMFDVIGQPSVDILEDLLDHFVTMMKLIRNRLQHVSEGISDTEALVNINLDNKRNELFAFNLLASVTAVSLTIIAAVAGIFGMNLTNHKEDSYASFVVVSSVSSGVCVALILLFLVAAWSKGWLFIPDPAVVTSAEKMPDALALTIGKEKSK